MQDDEVTSASASSLPSTPDSFASCPPSETLDAAARALAEVDSGASPRLFPRLRRLLSLLTLRRLVSFVLFLVTATFVLTWRCTSLFLRLPFLPLSLVFRSQPTATAAAAAEAAAELPPPAGISSTRSPDDRLRVRPHQSPEHNLHAANNDGADWRGGDRPPSRNLPQLDGSPSSSSRMTSRSQSSESLLSLNHLSAASADLSRRLGDVWDLLQSTAHMNDFRRRGILEVREGGRG